MAADAKSQQSSTHNPKTVIKVPAAETAPPKRNKAANPHAARIADYRREALARTDNLAAAVGAANADLMDMDCRLHGFIEESLKTAVNSFGEFKQLDPAIKRRLDTLRQVERLAQLDRKLAATNSGAVPPTRKSSNKQ